MRAAPVYAPGMAFSGTHASILVPAARYRVLTIGRAAERDVLVAAVQGLRAANVTSSTIQADLLQLPEDLVKYLNDVSNQIAHGEGDKQLQWIIQDSLTGQVLPTTVQPADAVRVDYRQDGWPRRLVMGTAGRPIVEPVFALTPPDELPAPPDPTRVVQALSDGGLRVDGVFHAGPPARVFVRMRIGAIDGEPTVVDPVNGVPIPGLTTRLRVLAADNPHLAKWIAPSGDGRSFTSRPLARAIERLARARVMARGRAAAHPVHLAEFIAAARSAFHRVIDGALLGRSVPDERAPEIRAHFVRRVLEIQGQAGLAAAFATHVAAAGATTRSSATATIAEALLVLGAETTSPLWRAFPDWPPLLELAMELDDLEQLLSPEAPIGRLTDVMDAINDRISRAATAVNNTEAQSG